MNNNSQELKHGLLITTTNIKIQIGELKKQLMATTPMASQLTVMKDIEKLQKHLDKVQMGIQELAL